MKVSVAKALRSVDEEGGDFVFCVEGDIEDLDVADVIESAVETSDADPNLLTVSRCSGQLVEVVADLKGDEEQATALVAGVEVAFVGLEFPGKVKLSARQPGVDLFSTGEGPMFGRPVMMLKLVPPDPAVLVDMGVRREGTGVKPELARSAVSLVCTNAEWVAVGAGSRFYETAAEDAPDLVLRRMKEDPFGSTDVLARSEGEVLVAHVSGSNIEVAATIDVDASAAVRQLTDWAIQLTPLPKTAVLLARSEMIEVGTGRGYTSAGLQWGTAIDSVDDGHLLEVGWFTLITPELDADPKFSEAVRSLGLIARREGRELWIGDLEDWLPDPDVELDEFASSRPAVPPSEVARHAREVLAPFFR